MEDSREILKDFEHKKEAKKKMEDYHEIRIKFKKSWLIHATYIVIILILLVLAVYNPLGSNCRVKDAEIISEPVVTGAGDEVKAEPEVEEDPGPEIEPEPKPEPGVEEEPETKLSGKAGLTLGEIGLSNGSKKIGYIWAYINNDKGLFTPLVYIYWYGPSTTDIVKSKPKYAYQFPSLIPTGQTTRKLDEELDRLGGRPLEGRYLNLDPEDKKVTFKVEIYDANDNETVLDSKLKSITLP